MKSSFFGNRPEPATDTVDPGSPGIDPQQAAGQSQWHPPLLPPSGPQVEPAPAGTFPPDLAALLGTVPGGAQQQTSPQGQSGGASPQYAPSRVRPPLAVPDFQRAITTVIDTHEGGFQDRDDDPGNFTPSGEKKGTKYGISAAAYPNEDIKNLTKQRAAELYRNDYGLFAALADRRVLTKVLDLAVDMQHGGHGPATRILQQAINASGGSVRVDGVFGVKTADVANTIPPDVLLKAIVDQAAAHYAEIEQARPAMKAWFKNWDERAQWQPQGNKSRVQPSAASPSWDGARLLGTRTR